MLERKTQPARTAEVGELSVHVNDDESLAISSTHNGETSSMVIHPHNAWRLVPMLCFMLGIGTTPKEISSALMKVKM